MKLESHIESIRKTLTASNNSYRKFLSSSLFVFAVLWTPGSVLVFPSTLYYLAPLTVIGIGIYDLFSSGFLRVVRPVVLITFGIGIQLVTAGVVNVRELLVLWPLSLLTFGVLVFLSDLLYSQGRKKTIRS